MYEDIIEQIKIAKEEKQQILFLGDVNVKIVAAIEGDQTQFTKGGRQVMN